MTGVAHRPLGYPQTTGLHSALEMDASYPQTTATHPGVRASLQRMGVSGTAPQSHVGRRPTAEASCGKLLRLLDVRGVVVRLETE